MKLRILLAVFTSLFGVATLIGQSKSSLFVKISSSTYKKQVSENVKWSETFKCPITKDAQNRTTLVYQFYSASEVEYLFVAYFASKGYRPVRLSINGILLDEHFAHCFEEKGSWRVGKMKDAVPFTSKKGTNEIIIESNAWQPDFLPIPHFHEFRIHTGAETGNISECK